MHDPKLRIRCGQEPVQRRGAALYLRRGTGDTMSDGRSIWQSGSERPRVTARYRHHRSPVLTREVGGHASADKIIGTVNDHT